MSTVRGFMGARFMFFSIINHRLSSIQFILTGKSISKWLKLEEEEEKRKIQISGIRRRFPRNIDVELYQLMRMREMSSDCMFRVDFFCVWCASKSFALTHTFTEYVTQSLSGYKSIESRYSTHTVHHPSTNSHMDEMDDGRWGKKVFVQICFLFDHFIVFRPFFFLLYLFTSFYFVLHSWFNWCRRNIDWERKGRGGGVRMSALQWRKSNRCKHLQ